MEPEPQQRAEVAVSPVDENTAPTLPGAASAIFASSSRVPFLPLFPSSSTPSASSLTLSRGGPGWAKFSSNGIGAPPPTPCLRRRQRPMAGERDIRHAALRCDAPKTGSRHSRDERPIKTRRGRDVNPTSIALCRDAQIAQVWRSWSKKSAPLPPCAATVALGRSASLQQAPSLGTYSCVRLDALGIYLFAARCIESFSHGEPNSDIPISF